MRILAALTLALFLFAIAPSVAAQSSSDDLKRVADLKLDQLTKPVSVHYSASGKARAKIAAKLISEASKYHSKQAGLTTQFTIAVLDPTDWKTVRGQRPYGALSSTAKPHVIFIPADDESEIGKLWRQYETSFPSQQRALLTERGTLYIGIHELGHTLIEESRINVGNKWFNEFLATYYAYSFLKAKYPKDAAAWLASAKAFSGGYTPQYRGLDDFERLYSRVGSANYSWYQARFLQLGAEIYDAKGYSFLTSVNRDMPKLAPGQDWLDELLKNPVPRAELLARLDKIDSRFSPWAEQMK